VPREFSCRNIHPETFFALWPQEPELSLKRVAASSLADISKHTPELAQAVVDAGAVPYVAALIVNPDGKLKRQVRRACFYLKDWDPKSVAIDGKWWFISYEGSVSSELEGMLRNGVPAMDLFPGCSTIC
jgi:hypothetical protein